MPGDAEGKLHFLETHRILRRVQFLLAVIKQRVYIGDIATHCTHRNCENIMALSKVMRTDRDYLQFLMFFVVAPK